MTIHKRKITDYQPNPRNHNRGTERGSGVIEHSFRQYGAGRSLLADKNGVLIAGNQSQQGALNAGIEDVIEVETDGHTVVVVKRTDLDLSKDKRAVELAYADNRTNELSLDYDVDTMLKDIEAGVDLSRLWSSDELDGLLQSVQDSQDEFDIDLSDFRQQNGLTRNDVPDALFPTDNDWGVPTLDLAVQAVNLELPAIRWGKFTRKKRVSGTYHFYIEDFKFSNLWEHPEDVVNASAAAIIEPNFSTGNDTPRAVVLWGIYRKRWLARWWQQFGIKVFVDLNIEAVFEDIALLGVPQGWKAYANRGYGTDMSHLDTAFEWAQSRSGVDNPLYVVYGGGKSVTDHCKRRGWISIMEDAHVSEGRHYG